MLSPRLLTFGREDALPEPLTLRAGPLAMRFEPHTGFLRTIRCGDREVLRAIYAAVRDARWGTVTPQITLAQSHIGDDRFRIAFEAVCARDEIDFRWRGEITGESDGTVTYAMDGVARSTFRRNRIGFCVLHPIRGCAGQPCTVEHTDGSVASGVFPRDVSPHQPFFDLRAISHEAAPGVRATVRFAGDTFEMEDQRNWTDASFKTYCTPLALPLPVEVAAGTRIRQSVTLTVEGTPESAVSAAGPAPTATDPQPPVPLPGLGLVLSPGSAPPDPEAAARLRALRLTHLRVDLRVSGPPGAPASEMEAAATAAEAVGAPLEVALYLGDDLDAARAALDALANAVARRRPRLTRWLVPLAGVPAKASGEWLGLVRSRLAGCAPDVPVFAGADANFTELNRQRPPLDAVDGLFFGMNPQVHAFDDATLMENLEGQRETVRSAANWAPGLPLVVSPITLRPRRHPEPDPRHAALLGAAWTVGSIARLATQGVSVLTYFETVGPKGLVSGEGSVAGGSVYPVYHVFADLGVFRGGEISASPAREDAEVAVIGLQREGATRQLVANLTPAKRDVAVPLIAPAAAAVRVKVLDTASVVRAVTEPDAWRNEPGARREPDADGALRVTLGPYAVARIDDDPEGVGDEAAP
jgi:hypothetical protein